MNKLVMFNTGKKMICGREEFGFRPVWCRVDAEALAQFAAWCRCTGRQADCKNVVAVLKNPVTSYMTKDAPFGHVVVECWGEETEGESLFFHMTGVSLSTAIEAVRGRCVASVWVSS